MDFELPSEETYQKYIHSASVFQTIEDISAFYDYLSIRDDSTTVIVAKGPINFNYDIYVSLSNTIDSIKRLLELGRINDAFSLIRKYNDAIIIHIYALIVSEKEETAFFEEGYSLYDNIVNEWVCGNKRLIEKKECESTEKAYLKTIQDRDLQLSRLLFDKEKQKKYGHDRNVGDDNVHYNMWNNFRLNNSQIRCYPEGLRFLSEASDAVKLLFIIHFSYLILLKPEVMVSNEYLNALEEEQEPDEEAMDYAASIVCEMFEKYVDKFDKRLATYLCGCTFLKLKYNIG